MINEREQWYMQDSAYIASIVYPPHDVIPDLPRDYVPRFIQGVFPLEPGLSRRQREKYAFLAFTANEAHMESMLRWFDEGHGDSFIYIFPVRDMIDSVTSTAGHADSLVADKEGNVYAAISSLADLIYGQDLVDKPDWMVDEAIDLALQMYHDMGDHRIVNTMYLQLNMEPMRPLNRMIEDCADVMLRATDMQYRESNLVNRMFDGKHFIHVGSTDEKTQKSYYRRHGYLKPMRRLEEFISHNVMKLITEMLPYPPTGGIPEDVRGDQEMTPDEARAEEVFDKAFQAVEEAVEQHKEAVLEVAGEITGDIVEELGLPTDPGELIKQIVLGTMKTMKVDRMISWMAGKTKHLFKPTEQKKVLPWKTQQKAKRKKRRR